MSYYRTGSWNAHPITKDMKRKNRKENLAYRKLTPKQKAVYHERKKLIEEARPIVSDFIDVFDKLKIKIPMSLWYKGRGSYSGSAVDFAEEYVPSPEMPDKGNPKKERRPIR